MRTQWIVALALLLSGCTLGEVSLAGKQCFAAADCASGYVCAQNEAGFGTCVSTEIGTPGAELGTDSGVPDPDGGGVVEGPLGLPCELRSVLKSQCQTCHNSQHSNFGAPMPLLSWEHLTSPAKSNASLTVAEISIQRMRNASAPMPPSGLRPEAEVALLEEFVASGYVKESCGGTGDGGTEEPPPDWRLTAAPTCTSGDHWTGGDDGSPRMHPGRACITCHQNSDDDDAPDLLIGGTLFPTAHEPDDCLGGGIAGATVIITDQGGTEYPLTPNTSGNFLLERRDAPGFTFPFRAKVVTSAGERHMATPQTNGNCNSCHTQSGTNGAPGRIVPPS